LIRGSAAGADWYSVNSTPAGSTTKIEGNHAGDQFQVATGNLDTIAGMLRVTGQGAGVNNKTTHNGNVLTLNDGDATNTQKVSYQVNPTSVVNDTSLAPSGNALAPRPVATRPFAGVFFDGTIDEMHLGGTNGVNVFDTTPSVNTQFFINGNLPAPGTAQPGG